MVEVALTVWLAPKTLLTKVMAGRVQVTCTSTRSRSTVFESTAHALYVVPDLGRHLTVNVNAWLPRRDAIALLTATLAADGVAFGVVHGDGQTSVPVTATAA